MIFSPLKTNQFSPRPLETKAPLPSSGFSLVEVIVGMLIAMLFVASSMQLMVYAMLLQTQGREMSTTKSWIQEDIEQIRSLAAGYKSTQLTAPTTLAATTINVEWVDGFASGDTLRIGSDPTPYSVTAVSTTPAQLTLNPAISAVQASGGNVIAINMCNATTAAFGFAQALRTELPSLVASTRTIGGQTYTLIRGGPGGSTIPVVANTPPYHILQLNYHVVPQGSTNPVAVLDTEVIPDAALKCP